MRFKGDIIIVDPGNVVKSEEDWQLCQWGKNMGALGFENVLHITSGDEYGCQVLDVDTDKKIGEFCTDSTLLIVTYFEDVLKYNPDFKDHINWPDSNAIIKGFDGEVTATVEQDSFFITGKGNINFKTIEV